MLLPRCVRAATATSRRNASISSSSSRKARRAYIERINIHGNTRTRDYVIRREFDIGEGDAYNRALIDRAERRLKNLNYFKTVKITNEPGSAPDRVVVDVNVEEKADRRVLGLRRLLDRQRLDLRGQHRRPQPHGPRPVRQGRRSAMASMRAASSCRSSSPICWATAWPAASTCSRKQNLATSYVSYNSQTIGVNLRLGFALTRRTVVAAALFDLSAEDHAAGSSEQLSIRAAAKRHADPQRWRLRPTDSTVTLPNGCYARRSSLPVRWSLRKAR